jgi:WD40 repeat protein
MSPWTARFGPDGKSLTATGTGGVFAWDMADLSAEPRVVMPSSRWATEMNYHPRENIIAMGNFGSVIYLKNLTQPEKPATEFLVQGSANDTWSVAFSPNGKLLASGGKTDPAVRLWEPKAPGDASILLGRHDEAVTRVRFSPDGRQLASASLDYSVRLWDVENPDALPIVLSGHEGEVWSLAYSPDGRHLLAGSRDKTIRIWDLSHPLNNSTTREIADKVCQIVWRNLTLDEWHKFVGVELPYERTCPNLPIHPSLFQAAEKLAKENDMEAAAALLERAVELDPSLEFDPVQEARRLSDSSTQ